MGEKREEEENENDGRNSGTMQGSNEDDTPQGEMKRYISIF